MPLIVLSIEESIILCKQKIKLCQEYLDRQKEIINSLEELKLNIPLKKFPGMNIGMKHSLVELENIILRNNNRYESQIINDLTKQIMFYETQIAHFKSQKSKEKQK